MSSFSRWLCIAVVVALQGVALVASFAITRKSSASIRSIAALPSSVASLVPSTCSFAFGECSRESRRAASLSTTVLFLQDNDNNNNEEEEEEGDGSFQNATASTQQQQEVTVKRPSKGKKGGQHNSNEYKILDNRDSLPFAVQITTPDPYTHPDLKKQQQPRSDLGGGRNALLSRTPKSKTNKPSTDFTADTISSTLYDIGNGDDSLNNNSSNKKKKKKKQLSEDALSEQNAKTWLGEFVLDKYTTVGDILDIGWTQYKVVRHRCQYKYAGGQRFEMVRKILEVKEINRARTEEYLQRQFEQ